MEYLSGYHMREFKNEDFCVPPAHKATHIVRQMLVAFMLGSTIATGQAIGSDIKAPDMSGNVGKFTSLMLSAEGNPVVAYHDLTHRDLKLLRCNNPNCDDNQSGNISVLDTQGMVGTYASLALDAAGKPVISYYDSTKGVLKLLHCNSTDCESYNTSVPDKSDIVGMYTSLALDSDGNPVVSYYDSSNGDLKLLYCDDPACKGDESKNTSIPDSKGDVGLYTSLALDNKGNPVISYFASKTGLRLLHCDDPNCQGDESGHIATPDKGDVGWYSSLALDAVGNPVIGYYDFSSGNLKILHCDNPGCAGSQSKNITTPDTAPKVGDYLDMVLDRKGNPVVSYHDSANGDLKLLHCDNPNCAADQTGNIAILDAKGEVGLYTSLVLDSAGNPVVSYYDFTNGDLKLRHCANQNCSGN
jgi:hypothetical protein